MTSGTVAKPDESRIIREFFARCTKSFDMRLMTAAGIALQDLDGACPKCSGVTECYCNAAPLADCE
jgi:hypothetical protein